MAPVFDISNLLRATRQGGQGLARPAAGVRNALLAKAPQRESEISLTRRSGLKPSQTSARKKFLAGEERQRKEGRRLAISREVFRRPGEVALGVEGIRAGSVADTQRALGRRQQARLGHTTSEREAGQKFTAGESKLGRESKAALKGEELTHKTDLAEFEQAELGKRGEKERLSKEKIAQNKIEAANARARITAGTATRRDHSTILKTEIEALGRRQTALRDLQTNRRQIPKDTLDMFNDDIKDAQDRVKAARAALTDAQVQGEGGLPETPEDVEVSSELLTPGQEESPQASEAGDRFDAGLEAADEQIQLDQNRDGRVSEDERLLNEILTRSATEDLSPADKIRAQNATKILRQRIGI